MRTRWSWVLVAVVLFTGFATDKATAEVSCDIQMSQAIYLDGDTVTANAVQIANTGTAPQPVFLAIWLGVPGVPPIFLVQTVLVLPPGLDIDLGPMDLFVVNAGLPRGDYEFSIALIQLTTGEITLDRNPFTVSEDALVTFEDATLEYCVATRLGVNRGEVTQSLIATLTDLSCNLRGIVGLGGLQYATSLTRLSLNSNEISDVTPLAGLTSLRELVLGFNEISDVTPLTGLTSLYDLDLETNRISDVTPLASLTSLSKLDLRYNCIDDFSPVAFVPNLYGPGEQDPTCIGPRNSPSEHRL